METLKNVLYAGVGLAQHTEDKMKGELEIYPFVKSNPIKTLVPPVIKKRLAESYEKQRLELE